MSKISDLLPEIGNIVAYCPQLALALGGCVEGIFMSQLLFWHDKVPDGSIEKTREQVFAATGLGRWEQKTARIHLVSLGVITEEHDWAKNKLYFTVNLEALKAVWKRYRETGASPTFEAKPKKRPPGEVARLPSRARVQKKKKKKRERNAGQAGSHPPLFSVTESESQTPHSSAPPLIQSNGASDAPTSLPKKATKKNGSTLSFETFRYRGIRCPRQRAGRNGSRLS